MALSVHHYESWKVYDEVRSVTVHVRQRRYSLLYAHHSLINQSPFELRSTNTTCPTRLADSLWVLTRGF